MLNESRIDLYDYLYNIFYDVVTKNVHSMREPQELTESDTNDGFIVIRVGTMNDESEFSGETYGWARCFVEAFVPPISRGRLDFDKYKEFEDSILTTIKLASQEAKGKYHIEEDSIISSETEETTNANNSYFTFIKSFIVVIDKQGE